MATYLGDKVRKVVEPVFRSYHSAIQNDNGDNYIRAFARELPEPVKNGLRYVSDGISSLSDAYNSPTVDGIRLGMSTAGNVIEMKAPYLTPFVEVANNVDDIGGIIINSLDALNRITRTNSLDSAKKQMFNTAMNGVSLIPLSDVGADVVRMGFDALGQVTENFDKAYQPKQETPSTKKSIVQNKQVKKRPMVLKPQPYEAYGKSILPFYNGLNFGF